MSLLSVTSLTKKYEETTAVDAIDFSLGTGKCIALIGPNGAGKTTILRILANLLKPTEGKVTFGGQPANVDTRAFIGYLPQYPVFPEWMTAKEFLTFSGELANLSKLEAMGRGEELLERVGLDEVVDKEIGGFSGGMKQRLGIAQAMIHEPKLLLLDEPVSPLDPIGRREVLKLLENLKDQMTILFSTHILNDAEEICDDLLLLNKGKIVESGALEELRRKYQTSIIELAFQADLQPIQEKLRSLPSISNCYVEKDTIKVVAADISLARREILQAAVQENWPILRFHLHRASLEELFMKAVEA